jgi:hypothetical protein
MPPHNLSLIFMGMKEKIMILDLILVDLPMIDSKTLGGGLTYNLYDFVPLP